MDQKHLDESNSDFRNQIYIKDCNFSPYDFPISFYILCSSAYTNLNPVSDSGENGSFPSK